MNNDIIYLRLSVNDKTTNIKKINKMQLARCFK